MKKLESDTEHFIDHVANTHLIFMNEILTGQSLEYIRKVENYYNWKIGVEFNHLHILLTGLKKEIYNGVYNLSADEYMNIYIKAKDEISAYMDEHHFKHEIFLFFYYNTKQICVLFNRGNHTDEDIDRCAEFINTFLQGIYEKEIFKGESKYFNYTTLSPLLQGYKDIKPAFDRLLELQKLSFFQTESFVMSDEKLDKIRQPISYSQVHELAGEVMDYVDMGQLELTKNRLDEIFMNYLKNSFSLERCNEVLFALKETVYRYNLMYDLGLDDELENAYTLSNYTRIGDIYTSIQEGLYQCVNAIMASGNGIGHISQSAVKYIKSHYTSDLSLTDIAEHVNVSSSYISNTFNREVGISIPRYINRLRVEKSKRLLKNENIRIGDVAKAVGFRDANYFGRVFKKQEGQSPEAYRDSHRKSMASESENP